MTTTTPTTEGSHAGAAKSRSRIGWAGITFSVLFVVGFFLITNDVENDASDADFISWWSDTDNLRRVLADDEARLGVAGHPRALVGRVGGVDRDHDGARLAPVAGTVPDCHREPRTRQDTGGAVLGRGEGVGAVTGNVRREGSREEVERFPTDSCR